LKQTLQEKQEKVFYEKIRLELNIIIILHFLYIFDILQPEGFCDA